MSLPLDSVEEKLHKSEEIPNWKDRFRFPPGAIFMILFQWISGMGAYCYILAMPIYMASILKFSDTTSTTIYHAKAGAGCIMNIIGAIMADSFLGRKKTFLIFNPVDLMLLGTISVLAIYSMKEGIIVCYFLLAIFGGIVGPALRTLIADQIPQKNTIMLSTFMHIIYFINNFGVIIIAYTAPIMHKDIYCFGMECYPLVFMVSTLLSCLAFGIFLICLFMKLLVIYEPTDNLLLDILKCIYGALKKRIKLGPPLKDRTWLDYSTERFGPDFVHDIKIVMGLLVFLLAHPLFWTVFEQLSSIWTLQAQYMDGVVTKNFIIKANQMQTLNPIFVVILIPVFEVTLYPFLTRINLRIPYRIMAGQMFTALACVSMVFIQLKIDNVVQTAFTKTTEINIVNLVNSNIQLNYGSASMEIRPSEIKFFTSIPYQYMNIKSVSGELNVSMPYLESKIFSTVVYQTGISSAEVSKQTNGGYSNVRIFDHWKSNRTYSILLKAIVGINKEFALTASKFQFGKYIKCGIGLFDIFLIDSGNSVRRKLGDIILHPAEAKTLIITGNETNTEFIGLPESRLLLPTIMWQIIPYFLVTIGEVLFNVNTGVFLYTEAPLSMKSILMAAQYVCISIGNILILVLKQILQDLSAVYLFLVCGILVLISAIFTGVLGYFYLRNKDNSQHIKAHLDSTKL